MGFLLIVLLIALAIACPQILIIYGIIFILAKL